MTKEYNDVKNCFFNIIGYITMILQYDSYKESHEEYRKILDIISKWLIIYEEKRDLSLINHKKLLDIYKRLDNLQTKYMCNDNMGDEDEFSDYAVNWMWDLMCLRKKQIERNGE